MHPEVCVLRWRGERSQGGIAVPGELIRTFVSGATLGPGQLAVPAPGDDAEHAEDVPEGVYDGEASDVTFPVIAMCREARDDDVEECKPCDGDRKDAIRGG